MITAEPKLSVERSQQFAETNFKIKASAKAFRVLSSGLYSDKIKAIVRELSTNAADSHIMAGCAAKPFQVHLPNLLEPWFSIRDFGTGLSPEDIEGIYTTYFESNKTNSNDVTGCLGLGSKSPFSYVDNFTVTSYFNGRKYVYTAFMNELGVPSVASLSEDDTSEGNGLEVAFPVEQKDFYTFIDRAQQVYKYFNVKPEITGASVEFVERKPTHTGNGWVVYRGKTATATLVMGNVAYPVTLRNADCWHQLFADVGIEMHCAIGEVEMTASREALEYTERTKAAIQQRAKDCIDSWTQIILDELAKQRTYWEACLYYQDNSLWIKNGTLWNNRPVASSISLPNNIVVNECKHGYRGIKYNKDMTLSQVNVRKEVLFVEDDLERGTKLRCLQYMRNNERISRIIIVQFADATQREHFVNTLGLPDDLLIKASSLPKMKYNKTGKHRQKIVYEFDGSGRNNRQAWTPEDFTALAVTKCAYVVLDGWDIQEFRDRWTIRRVMDMLQGAGYNIGKVYGVRKQMLKYVVNNSNWTPLKKALKDAKAAHAKDRDLILSYEEYLQKSKLSVFKDKLVGLDISALLDKIDYVKRNAARLEKLAPLMRYKETSLEVDSAELKQLKAMEEKYPLLFCIVNNVQSTSWPINDLVNYINLVNDKEKLNATVQAS